MVLFRNGTDKNRFRTHFLLSFPTCKRSPSFWNRSASFFLETVVLLRQPLTVNLMRFTPYIFAAIWRIKRRKLHHEKLQQKRWTLDRLWSQDAAWYVLLKNTLPWVIGYIVIALEFRVLFFRRDTKIIWRIHPLSFEVRSQAHAD